ncbi:MAG: hypothetical protein JJT96_15060 [Opitutales bacterium]|nr:hypothetical protein [Opitutales bacterium]
MRFESPCAAYLLHLLMGGDSQTLVCLAKAHPADARTMALSDALPLAESSALLVPSPMSARTGRSQSGRESPRCLANTGPRRWAVVEFDFAADDPCLSCHDMDSIDACAALLWALRSRVGRLALVCHSGGKSLHGWFRCWDWEEMYTAEFFDVAVVHGADPATRCRAQMVRMPDGRRCNGARQSVLFFDPAEVAK